MEAPYCSPEQQKTEPRIRIMDEPLYMARIPAASQRQAMDWGLVLASQGIEATIECSEDGGQWGLVVGISDIERATQAIHLYQIENRAWPWQQPVLSEGYLFDWGSLAWVLLIIVFYAVASHVDLRSAGMVDSSLLARGQWWRLFTAIWLHADVGHLATNACFGFVLLGLTMGRYGTGIGLLAACLGGAAGNLASWLIAAGPHRALGASGMVMAALGLLAAQAFSLRGRTPHVRKLILAGVSAGVMLFVLLGLTPGTDIMAHLGGFVSGLLLGAALSRVPALAQKVWLNMLGGLLFGVLIIVPWWLAFRKG